MRKKKGIGSLPKRPCAAKLQPDERVIMATRLASTEHRAVIGNVPEFLKKSCNYDLMEKVISRVNLHETEAEIATNGYEVHSLSKNHRACCYDAPTTEKELQKNKASQVTKPNCTTAVKAEPQRV